MKTIKVLDCSGKILLDGHGNSLPVGADPVVLELTDSEAMFATNSRGERFNPPPIVSGDGASETPSLLDLEMHKLKK